jgi:hypothetical protein
MRGDLLPHVISSASEKSFPFAVNRCMRVNGNGKPIFSVHGGDTVLHADGSAKVSRKRQQRRSLGCARDDDTRGGIASHIVKMDVLVDGRTQLVAATELIQGIHLCLHNSPETFHWAIVDAMPNAGHGLLHSLLRELELECFTGILEPLVTVEQRVCFRIFANRLLKCVKHQLIVIASAYDVGDN